jgi:hypothetical protein
VLVSLRTLSAIQSARFSSSQRGVQTSHLPSNMTNQQGIVWPTENGKPASTTEIGKAGKYPLSSKQQAKRSICDHLAAAAGSLLLTSLGGVPESSGTFQHSLEPSGKCSPLPLLSAPLQSGVKLSPPSRRLRPSLCPKASWLSLTGGRTI